MKHIYSNALDIIMKRIKSCGTALSKADDEYSVLYWNMQLTKSQLKAFKVKQRLNRYSNVIKIDFISKKRVA